MINTTPRTYSQPIPSYLLPMNSHNYNTARLPIILKRYGRNIQNLVNHIATVQDPQKRNQYAENLIPILQNLSAPKNKKDTNTAALWSDLYIMSDYKIQITPPCQVPTNTPLPPPKTQPIPYRHTQKNKFKCCGNILTQFIKKVLSTLTSDPQHQKKHITILIEMVQAIPQKERQHILYSSPHRRNIPKEASLSTRRNTNMVSSKKQ